MIDAIWQFLGVAYDIEEHGVKFCAFRFANTPNQYPPDRSSELQGDKEVVQVFPYSAHILAPILSPRQPVSEGEKREPKQGELTSARTQGYYCRRGLPA